MKIFTPFVLLMLIFPFYGFSQQTILKGTVTDSETGLTLPGVNVVVNKTTGVATDIDGNYSLTLDKGTHSIAFRFIGYTEEIRLINLKEGETLVLDMKMTTESRILDAVVVSAGKYEQKLSDVTVSMEVIKADFIRNTNVSSLEEGLQKIPGLNIMDKQPSIR
ncbi:MAG: TonB-dependent receptor, partial [Sphingobacteriia bacterium]|nr:TonB-dependent receptor [Sphingobacteriia bacterium]